MKKLLLASLALATLFITTDARAALDCAAVGLNAAQCAQAQKSIDETNATNASNPDFGSPSSALPSTSSLTQAAGEAGKEVVKTVGSFFGSITLSVVFGLLAWIVYPFFLLAQFFAWVAGALLDATMYFLIVKMGDFINFGGGNGIRDAWAAIRDLCNIAIIGGLVAVAFSTILNVETYSAKTYLARLIIAAMLVNFSYFFAGAIIDASNFVASAIMDSKMMRNGCTQKSVVQMTGVNEAPCSFYNTFANATHLDTWDSIKGQAASASSGNGEDTNFGIFMISLMGTIFLFIAGYVFFEAALLLIGRFVALIMLLIASPFGIAGPNIPFISQYANQWWGALWGQAFLAPAYMLLMAIALNIMATFGEYLKADTSKDGFAGFKAGGMEGALATIPLVISFAVSVGLMYAALAVAKQMSKSGETFFGGVYKAINDRFGGGYTGAFNWTRAGLTSALSGVGGAISNIPYVGKPLGIPLQVLGGLAKFVQSPPQLTKDYATAQKTTDTLSQNFQGMFGTPGALNAEAQKRARERDDLLKSNPPKYEADGVTRTKASEKLEGALNGMTPEQFAALTAAQQKTAMMHASDATLEAIMKSDKVSQASKDAGLNSRFAGMDRALASGNEEEIQRELKKMTDYEAKLYYIERRELMEIKKKEQYTNSLSKSQAAAITSDKGAHTKSQLDSFKDTRKQSVSASIKTGGAVMENRLKRMSDDEVGDMSIDDITQETVKHLPPSGLRKRFAKAKSIDEQNKIIKAIEANGGNPIAILGPAAAGTT